MGSLNGSPDSWSKKFFIMTAALKSDRGFKRPFLPHIQGKVPLSLVSFQKTSKREETYDFLLQINPTLCAFVLSIRLRVVIHD